MSHGECTRCGAYILIVFRDAAGRREGICSGCHELATERGTADHDSRLRCPKCKATWYVSEHDGGELYGEGQHAISCPECGHDFEIETHVYFSFTSPELNP